MASLPRVAAYLLVLNLLMSNSWTDRQQPCREPWEQVSGHANDAHPLKRLTSPPKAAVESGIYLLFYPHPHPHLSLSEP